MLASVLGSSHRHQVGMFPANLYSEGHDQHSRWFLTSLVSSVALTGQAPFLHLKTHGLLIDNEGEKISKSKGNSNFINTEDLIFGTVKMDGNRKHGYGLDTIRAWAVCNDGDRNAFVDRADIEKANNEVKMIRSLFRVLLGNLSSYESRPFDFSRLTPVDQMMTLRLIRFSVQVTDAYERLDLGEAYRLVQAFIADDLSSYYLEFSRQRLLMKSTTSEYSSTQMVYSRVLLQLLHAIAPVLVNTAQETYQSLPESLKNQSSKSPATVFQMRWFSPAVDVPVESDVVTDFKRQDAFA